MTLRFPMALAALAAACLLAQPAQAAHRACGWSGYSYAGFEAAAAAYGVSARITVLSQASVESGHVAAWIGFGGDGLGPGGADEWVQAGIASFPDGRSELYYEYRAPGRRAPVYASLGVVGPGESHTVAVVERPAQPNTWRVWVDGMPMSPSIDLPASHGAWQPVATAESWDGGTPSCNRFAFDFDTLSVASSFRGAWRPFLLSSPIQAPGYRLRPRATAFTASAA